MHRLKRTGRLPWGQPARPVSERSVPGRNERIDELAHLVLRRADLALLLLRCRSRHLVGDFHHHLWVEPEDEIAYQPPGKDAESAACRRACRARLRCGHISCHAANAYLLFLGKLARV